MIPQSFIQDLLNRVDVAEVVGRHVKLRKAGANLQGLCPFHGEKTPSFTVSPTKQFYHCFGCGAHGSAIGFLMEHGGLGYVDAIEELAQSVGLTVPHEKGTRSTERDSNTPTVLELLTTATRYYQRRLKESPEAIEYLKGRGLSGVTAGKFALGYAPDGWRNLEAAVADYDDKLLETAGLVTGGKDDDDGSESNEQSNRRKKRYDRFRKRVMFPIRNPRGSVIGFGARIIGSGEPKYLNSPETPVFSKGRELYGLFEGRTALREANQAIVVEGYMDVVMLAEHGINNAVATLGTATTPDHIRKLLRIVDSLVFSFDGDQAGRKAAWRAFEACLPIITDTQRVQFLFLPDGADPDSYVRDHGAGALQNAIEDAQPLSAFMIDRLTEQGDLETPEGRARFLSHARPLLSALTADGLRMQMAREVADVSGIGLIELEQYINAAPADPRASREANQSSGNRRNDQPQGNSGGHSNRRPQPSRRAEQRPSVGVRAGSPALERRIRLLIVCHPGLAGQITTQLNDTSVLSDSLLTWIDALTQVPADSVVATTLELLRNSEPGVPDLIDVERDLASDWGAVSQLDPEEAENEFNGAMQQLQRRATEQAARQAANELQQSGLGDERRRQELLDLLASQKRS
jgi:DNA primase